MVYMLLYITIITKSLHIVIIVDNTQKVEQTHNKVCDVPGIMYLRVHNSYYTCLSL